MSLQYIRAYLQGAFRHAHLSNYRALSACIPVTEAPAAGVLLVVDETAAAHEEVTKAVRQG